MTTNQSEDTKTMNTIKVKKPGPIRWGAVVPVVTISVLTGLYLYFLFAGHLRWILEKGATQANKAEVNIARLTLNLKEGKYQILDIQVTNPDKPTHNRLRVESIDGEFSWDALLRMRLKINHAAITGITTDTLRETPGELVTESVAEKMVGENSVVGEELRDVKKAGLATVASQQEGNVLENVAAILGGSDPTAQLDNIKSELAVVKRSEEIKARIKAQEVKWKAVQEKMGGDQFVDETKGRINALSKKKIKKLKDAKEAIKELKSIKKEVKQKVGSVKGDIKQMKQEIKELKAMSKGLSKLAAEDRKQLEKRLNIPKLDTKSMAQGIFENYLRSKLGPYAKYLDMGKEYLPTKPEGKEGEVASGTSTFTPNERAHGRNYTFGKRGDYPRIWLQHGEISGHHQGEDGESKVKGDVKDLSSNQVLLGEPTKISIDGRYPVTNQIFSESKSVTFGLKKAAGSLLLDGTVEGGVLNLKLKNLFKQSQYNIKSNSRELEAILKESVSKLKTIRVFGTITGAIAKPDIKLKSNLSKALEKGIKRGVSKRIAAARAKVKGLVDGVLKGERGALDKLINKSGNESLKKLTGKAGKIADLSKDANQKIAQLKKDQKNKAKSKAKAKAKKKGKKLLKKFKKLW
jgi:uncharacterized protein (TIGR03545 family)